MLLLFLTAALLHAEDGCTVSGTVVNSVTGERLSKVELRLEPVEWQSAPVAVTTSDAEGRFRFVSMDADRYKFLARRSGYLETPYGALLQLETGQALEGLVFRLRPAAVISGTVRDSDGEPIEGAHVVLGRFTYSYDGHRIEGEDSTDTDDRGEYRFRGLEPGRYYVGVEAKGHDWNQVDRSQTTGPIQVSVPTLYPGVTELSLATPVEVALGGRANAIDITLVRSRVFRVAGRVTNAPSAGYLNLTLHDSRNGAMRDREMHTSTLGSSGEFQFRDVPPGSYDLTTGTGTLRAKIPILVGASDVEGIRVTLAPGADIRLKVVPEGDAQPDLAGIPFFLTADGRKGYVPDFPQGERWVVRNVPPDHYLLIPAASRSGTYVKSARTKDTDVLESGLTVTSPESIEIEVTLAADAGRVAGSVLDKNQAPLPGAVVALVPDKRSRFERFHNTTSDQNGRFEFAVVPPGDYKVFAWAEVELQAWTDPEFLKDYEKQGERVTVEPKGRVTLNVAAAVPPERK